MTKNSLLFLLLILTSCGSIASSSSDSMSNSSIYTPSISDDVPLDGYTIMVSEETYSIEGLKQLVNKFEEHSHYCYTLDASKIDNVLDYKYVVTCFKDSRYENYLWIDTVSLIVNFAGEDNNLIATCHICNSEDFSLEKVSDKEFKINNSKSYGYIKTKFAIDNIDDIVEKAKLVIKQ